MGKRIKPSLNRSFVLRPGEFARAAGAPLGYTIERNSDANRIDHLTITLRAGDFGVVEIALNTFSVRSLKAGFDPRIRLATVHSTWNVLPAVGVFPSAGLDYSAFETQNKTIYGEYERVPLEALLIEKINRGLLIEAWGEFYVRTRIGIHQIHSRRASCSVRSDHRGRDGAVKFYFEKNRTAELLLFKFCGQI